MSTELPSELPSGTLLGLHLLPLCLFFNPYSLGQTQPSPAPLSEGREQSRVNCSAQNSLSAPEAPTCLCRSRAPHLRGCSESSAGLPLPASVPGAPEQANMAARITRPRYLAPSCTQTSLPHSQVDTETLKPGLQPADQAVLLTCRVILSPRVH